MEEEEEEDDEEERVSGTCRIAGRRKEEGNLGRGHWGVRRSKALSEILKGWVSASVGFCLMGMAWYGMVWHGIAW